jgi:signal transduction histidine kinase
MYYFMDSKIELPPPPAYEFDSLMEFYLPDAPEIEVLRLDSGLISLRSGGASIILSDSGDERRIVTFIKPGERTVEWRSEDDNDFDIDVEVMEKGEYTVEYLDVEELEEIAELEKLHADEELLRNEGYVVIKHKVDSLRNVVAVQNEFRVKKEEMVKDKLAKFNESMQQWAFEYSFDENIIKGHNFTDELDTVIRRALLNNGIELEFLSQVIQENEDTVLIIKSATNDAGLISDKYKTELFPDDYFRKNLYLQVIFPGKSAHIYKSVSMMAFGSLLFTVIILLTFGLTLYYINKQKKISDIKSDFINNMTHEFKTPIATISLASDAMNSPKVEGDRKKSSYYLNIIRQENKRMNNQVEKVLQMALIENQDLQLDFQKTDIHTIIENTCHVVDLSATEKKGKITSVLRATCSEIPVDEIHFGNIINNLLDNAVKYTEKPPEILVETFTKGNRINIRISDNGVGMSKDVQKHIFDKFYRRPSGNIHNVKGFGLGLSYVKAIVEAHGGNITVSSEPGNGSIFTLSFDC